jgi:uncharacterized repeat protein (TIGR03803 family)
MTPARTRAILSGLLVLAVCTVACAASEKVLYAFHGKDGWGPSSVILGAGGGLYGTTMTGGANSCDGNPYGLCGVVFRLARGDDGKWREDVLHDFAGSDGMYPKGALVADKTGNLYGTTVNGGPSCSQLGCGVVFELVREKAGKWIFKVLHNFALTDGANPYAGVIFDSQGDLYGTASSGGNLSACSDEGGCGVVFKLTPDGKGHWTETVVYAFNGSDGGGPMSPVTFDSSGNLYGTTSYGGANRGGTVFELTPEKDGQWSERALHSFSFGTGDGYQPVYGVVFDGTGNFYGTTQFGGTVGGQGWGTAFELTSGKNGKWTETILRSFDRDKLGGGFVSSGLILDGKGNLYGSTGEGGRYSSGVVFRLTLGANGKWGEAVLHSFGQGNDGADPIGGLIFDLAGHLLGVASIGGGTGGSCGQDGCGVVFEITP